MEEISEDNIGDIIESIISLQKEFPKESFTFIISKIAINIKEYKFTSHHLLLYILENFNIN